MAVSVISIIQKAHEIVQDARGITYKVEQGLEWVNAGQRCIVNLRRDAGASMQVWQLAAGATQVLMPGYLQILGDVRNMGYDGATPGMAAVRVDREAMDSIEPSWASNAGQAPVFTEYMFDEDNPRTFFVYRPSDGLNFIEASVSVNPADIPDEQSDITIPDQFETPLINYVCWAWLGRDSERSPNYARAQGHKATFFELLGVSAQAKMEATAT